jgi:hypothetical protein
MSVKEEICGRIVFFAVLGFMFGSIWWSYDIVMSMKHGSWTALHFGDLLLKIGLKNFVKWVYYPNDWIGLSRMLKYILEMSSGFVCMAISAIVFFFGVAVHD